MLWGYNAALFLGMALGMPLLFPLVVLSQKRRKTILKRLGVTRIPRRLAHAPRAIWMHALSVGEVRASLPLIRMLKARYPERPILFSTSTLSGYMLATQSIDEIQKPVFFFPYDWWPSVHRVIHRVDPALVLIVETDLWPNFIDCLRQKKIPLILINARVSPRSYARYRRFQPWVRDIFAGLTGVCVPTDADARRFAVLGVPWNRIEVTGNLKYEYPGTDRIPSETQRLKKTLGFAPEQKVFIAGSTHKGEEKEILAAFLNIRDRFPGAGMLLAPRDPGRAAAVCRMGASLGVKTSLMSEQEGNEPKNTTCLVVDRLGILERLYGAADIVFIGGSLVCAGGHNPLEPAAWGKPILFGPDMSDFVSISESLVTSGGAIRVQERRSLAEEVIRLMGDPEAAEKMGRCALRVALEGKGAAEKILRVVATFMTERRPAGIGKR